MDNAKNILMVVTSHDRIDENHPTGLWLEEFAIPYLLFRGAGFTIAVASPQGGTAPIDPRSLPAEGKAVDWLEPLARLKSTLLLQDLNVYDFAAVFIPGGHGTMFDLTHNPSLKQLLSDFASAGKTIAAVCHGPAGLLNVQAAGGRPLVAGRTLTAFTNAEETAVQLDRLMPFLLETQLRATGARFVAAPPWRDHVEVDGNLITGQNPQSSASTARALIDRLNG